VRPDRGALLHDGDRELAARTASKLPQAARRGEACRPGTDDDDIELECLSRHWLDWCWGARSGCAL
jgi:hypothetical protein